MQISGYVAALRRAEATMQIFSVDGWDWCVVDGLLAARCPSKGCTLYLPIRIVVSGDIGAMPIACLRDAENQPVRSELPRSTPPNLFITALLYSNRTFSPRHTQPPNPHLTGC